MCPPYFLSKVMYWLRFVAVRGACALSYSLLFLAFAAWWNQRHWWYWSIWLFLKFLYKRYKAITVCWCNQPTSKNFQTCLYCIYLFKLYHRSIITLLANKLTNIWSEIIKLRLILWMVYIYLRCESARGSWKAG